MPAHLPDTNFPQFRTYRLPQQSDNATVQQPPRGVWQDNPTQTTARPATRQPAPLKKPMRPHPLKTKNNRSQKSTVQKRNTVHLTLWVKPRVKAELQRLAELEGLTVSTTGAVLLEQALQQNIATQHGALLETIINKALAKQMRAYSTRLAILLVRVAFASEQTRSLVTNILGRQQGMTPDTLNTILDSSSKAAKGKITYKSPQLESIIAEVEKWFTQREDSD